MMSSSLAHHVTLDCRFVNLFMSVVILEGVGRQLDKNLNIIAAALPVMRYAFPQYGEVGEGMEVRRRLRCRRLRRILLLSSH